MDDYLSLSGPQRRRLLEQVLATYGWRCCLCGLAIAAGTESLQHVIPRSKGGLTTLENSRPAHKRCNYAAGDRVSDGPAGMIHDGTAFFCD